MIFAAVLLGWLLLGFLAAGWEYADLHHSWAHGNRAPREDLSLVVVVWLMGLSGIFMEVAWRLVSNRGYGWKLPYSDLPHDERSTNVITDVTCEDCIRFLHRKERREGSGE